MSIRVGKLVLRSGLAGLGLFAAAAASAANLSVTTLADLGPGSLRAALATAGGNGQADVITFTVTGTITLASPLQLGADAAFLTDVQGPGAGSLTVSGGGAVRVFDAPAGIQLRLAGLTIANGLAAGSDGANGFPRFGGGGGGGGGLGGGLTIGGGNVTLESAVLLNNVALGGDGGWGAGGGTEVNGSQGGLGGASSQGFTGGGSLDSDGAGGSGGGGGAGIANGSGGGAGNAGGGGGQGGTAFTTLAGGSGGSGGGCGGGSGFALVSGDFGGRGGWTSGGVIGNQNCVTGAGGGGGGGLGGGIALLAGTLTLTDVVFSGNQATGGDRGFAFDGAETATPANDGLGKGGGLFVDSAGTVVATNVTFSGNSASDDLGSCIDNDDFYTRGTFPQDAPTDLALSAATVAENQPAGTVVGNLSTTDATPLDTFTYALVAGAGSTHNAQFQVVGAQLRTAAVLNFEAGAARSVRIRTTDACGQPYEEAVAVTVTNVNEAPTVAAAAFSIAENSPNGSAVGTVAASDPDAGTTLTWSIQSGNAGGAFAIGSGGQITVANVAALDFETTPSFTLAVRATDNGAPALFDEDNVTIALTNVNEAPTVAPAAFSVPENSPNGTAVGTVTASDPDAGSAFTWSIQSGNTDGAFAIGAGSGQLTVANPAALDFESAAPFALVVRATDNGAPALFAEGMVTVTVANVEEPVAAVADARSTDEDTPLVEPDPGVAGNDVDPDGLALVVTAFDATSVLGASVAVAPGGGFTYDPRPSAALQALRVGESLSDTFSYTVTDAGGTSSAATVTVEVAGVDAGLVLSKEALVGGTVAVGTSFAFRLTVLNEGPGVATGVVVEDPLPPLLAFVSSDCATYAGGVVTWLVGTLAAGAEASCELTVQGVGSGPVTNIATVSADDTDPEVDPVTASATVQLGLLQEIPALSPAGLALLALALAAIALAAMRRRRVR